MKSTSPAKPMNPLFKTHHRACALVLAGTKGSRLFPMTSSDTPKHLLPVAGVPSILRLLENLSSFPQIVVVINAEDSQTLSVLQQIATLLEGNENVQERGEEQSSSGNSWTLEMKNNKSQTITVLKLGGECFGPVDAMRQVEETKVIHESTRIVVFPGDLVMLENVLLDLAALLRPSPDSACTALLVDVGETDEHGVPLKESAKVSIDKRYGYSYPATFFAETRFPCKKSLIPRLKKVVWPVKKKTSTT